MMNALPLPRSVSFAPVVVGLLALFFTGCATSYRFKVDSIKNHDSDAPVTSFRIVNANPLVHAADPEFARAAGYVRTALSSKGMFEAPAGASADVNVEIDFGIEPRRRRFVSVGSPVYRTQPSGPPMSVPLSADKNGNVVSTIPIASQPPETVYVGDRTQIIGISEYPKYLRITARETPERAGDHPPREVWSIFVTNKDESRDLESYVPLMVSAAMDSIGRNAATEERVTLTMKDDRVLFVTRGM